jgi:hypothetical protein
VGDIVEVTHPIAKTYPALFGAHGPKVTHELPELNEKPRRGLEGRGLPYGRLPDNE